MRPIEFRAWDKEIKKMYSWEDMKDTKEGGIWKWLSIQKEIDRNILMQYIGWKDTSQKKIYEGDIVLVDDREIGAERTSTGEIFWCTDYTLCSSPCFAGWGPRGMFHLSPNIKILGNIYEDPKMWGDIIEKHKV